MQNFRTLLILLAFTFACKLASAQIDLPITFDNSAITYTMIDFGGNATVVGADPVNAANMVGITTKTAGAQTWAGTTLGNPNFTNPIPFTPTNHKMTVRVYAPAAGVVVRLKAEVNGQPSQSVETDAVTTMANAWETLTFDFDNQATGTAAFNASYVYDMASIFFNFGVNGADDVYYFDDVQMSTATGPSQINLPVTFDAPNTDYTMVDFGGNATVVGADPVNAANMVGVTTKTTGAQVWAGTTIGNPAFASPIPFTTNNHKMTVRVYSPAAGATIKLKVEVNGQPTQSVETDVLTTVANAWETLTFNFDNQSTGTAPFNPAYAYNVASIFFNFGIAGANEVYYFDDVMMYAAPLPSLPVTFEDPIIDYSRVDFDGGQTTLMANPFPSGINTSANVLQMIKNAGQPWGGAKMTLASPIDFSVNNVFKMKVYSPRVNCPVLFKLEGAGANPVEVTATTTVANAWEELSWDFNGAASNIYTDLIFIYDLGVMGDGSANFTFYQDDIMLVAGSPSLSQIDLPVTFEDTTVNYTLTDFGGNVTVLGADPTNPTNTVAITTKTDNAELWAGTTIGTALGFANVIPFTPTNRKMTVSVYSPDAGIPVRLKVEVHGQPTQSVETETLTTVANAWENIVFDFNNHATGTAAFDPAFPYDMASIFFNFGTTGAAAGTKTYYWDNVVFGGVISIENPINELVVLAPNPTTTYLYVQLPADLEASALEYQVVDMTGRTVADGKLTQNRLNVSNLSNGVYSFQINTDKGLVSKRFVKM